MPSNLHQSTLAGRSFVGGHFDPRTLRTLTGVALDIYHRTRLFCHAADAPPEAKELVEEMRQDTRIFEWFRRYRSDTGGTVSNNPETADAVYQRLCQRSMVSRIAADVCQSITRINRTGQELWTLTMDRPKGSPQREALKGPCFALRKKLLSLIATGITRDLPNSPANVTLSDQRKLHLAGVLEDRFEWCLRTGAERRQLPWIRLLMGRATGLSLFNLVRDQGTGHCEIGVDGLARSLASTSVRLRRSFQADIGRGVFDLFQISDELRRYGERAGWGTPVGKSFYNARLVILITLFQMLDSQALLAA